MIHRYFQAFNQALLADVAEEVPCVKTGMGSGKHQHFTVIQWEIHDDGNYAAPPSVMKNLHQKEIMEIAKELSANGVNVHIPNDLTTRIYNDAPSKEVTLCREMTQGKARFFVDVCRMQMNHAKMDKHGDVLLMISDYPDTIEGYTEAHARMNSTASQLNIKTHNFVDEGLWKK